MLGAKPYLLVRASLDPTVMDEFHRWYQEIHLPHVLDIPGIVRAYRTNWARGVTNWAAFYEFDNDESVQEALSSPQARVARLDWERWLPHVSELTVEVYASLSPLPTYHHWN
jgi:antibiotic biosynthesis monooxygenase (ABM) superfamily enzyme